MGAPHADPAIARRRLNRLGHLILAVGAVAMIWIGARHGDLWAFMGDPACLRNGRCTLQTLDAERTSALTQPLWAAPLVLLGLVLLIATGGRFTRPRPTGERWVLPLLCALVTLSVMVPGVIAVVVTMMAFPPAAVGVAVLVLEIHLMFIVAACSSACGGRSTGLALLNTAAVALTLLVVVVVVWRAGAPTASRALLALPCLVSAAVVGLLGRREARPAQAAASHRVGPSGPWGPTGM